ncbi:MAG: DUF2141 domain-containing protein [Bacteroidota bacterium]
MKFTSTILALLLSLGAVFAQGQLELTVNDINIDKGKIMVAIYNSNKSFLKHPFKIEKKESDDESVTLSFSNLPEGFYAISIYQDNNEDNELNIGRFGPKEPHGFSNNLDIKFTDVKFSEAKFKVIPYETSTQSISLK